MRASNSTIISFNLAKVGGAVTPAKILLSFRFTSGLLSVCTFTTGYGGASIFFGYCFTS